MPPRMTPTDQIARSQIGERMPTHDAPEQTDRENEHKNDEQHEAQDSRHQAH
jgi:hypothetical protein